jgi:hypothetical protein
MERLGLYMRNRNGLIENGIDAKIYRLIGAVQLGAVLMTDELNNAVHVFNMARRS